MVEPTTPSQETPRIRRGRVDSVDLYEIKDTELDLLEKGSPADIHLNFAIALITAAFTAITALSTATFANAIVQLSFIVAVGIGLVGGAYFGFMWWRSPTSSKAICRTIRKRIPTNGSTAGPAPR